jgi:IS4 transposase
VTSLPDEISAERVLELYRMRWQIELVFKRFKSIFGGGKFSARKEAAVKSWFYGKLLLAIICETFAKKGRFSP